jgi:DNA-cytosine methyltransferase
MLKVGCHFSGIGSVNESIKKFNLPMKVEYSIEYDTTTQAAYKEVFGTKKVYGDISKVNPKELPKVDIIVSSPPCQAFSNCGLKKSLSDDRGKILFETFRLIEYQKPKMVLFENVENLKGIDKGKLLKLILKLFDLMGYRTKYKLLNSINYNSCQSRNRLFIVAYDKNENIQFRFPQKQRLTHRLKDITCENPQGVSYLDNDKMKRLRFKVSPIKRKYQTNGRYLTQSHRRHDTTYEMNSRIYKPYICHTLLCRDSAYFYFDKNTTRTLTHRERFKVQCWTDDTIDKYLSMGLSQKTLWTFSGNTINVNVMGALLNRFVFYFDKFENKKFTQKTSFNVVYDFANHYIENHYLKNYNKRDYDSSLSLEHKLFYPKKSRQDFIIL